MVSSPLWSSSRANAEAVLLLALLGRMASARSPSLFAYRLPRPLSSPVHALSLCLSLSLSLSLLSLAFNNRDESPTLHARALFSLCLSSLLATLAFRQERRARVFVWPRRISLFALFAAVPFPGRFKMSRAAYVTGV